MFITLLVGLILGLGSGILIGAKIANRPIQIDQGEKTEVTSQSVIEKIKDQSFLITRSVISEQTVEINIDQGSAWSNFWWGHKISAKAYMQVDVGIDLSEVDEEDIQVNDETKVIIINLPEAEIHKTSLEGDITVSTKSGILKKLFKSSSNEDYNLALSQLEERAEEAVMENDDLLDEAESSALSTLQLLLNETGYNIRLG